MGRVKTPGMTTSTQTRHSTVKLGRNRKGARVYLQGKWLAAAGFRPGARTQAELDPRAHRVVIVLDAHGARVVSGKGEVPVLDLNSTALEDVFAGAEQLQVVTRHGSITITPARTAAKIATRCRNGREGALFAGGGLLSQAAREAGYTPAFAVEIDERYAEAFATNHPEAQVFCMDIAQVPLEALPPVELLTVGIPCEPFSKKRQKAGLPPEAHDLGDMVFWALRVIDHLNPATVVVEEVPGFLKSGAGFILLAALRRMGYAVDAQVVDSSEQGALAIRKRAIIVATSGGVPLFPRAVPCAARLGDLLDADVPEEAWFTRESKGWLFRHWEAQAAKGNFFARCNTLNAEARRVPALTKRYFAEQGDGVVLAHPTRPGTFRWLTVAEAKRLHGLPASYWLPKARTVAGEILGQGVVVSTFRRVIEANRRGGSASRADLVGQLQLEWAPASA
jgi:DNA (cytosine-5)-methyltransferase 1